MNVTFGPARNLGRSFRRIMSRPPAVRPHRRSGIGVEMAPPAGQLGSATNPRGPRSRRQRYWTPVEG